MSRIVVVGSANMDLVVSVERLPVAGETRLGSDLVTAFGGKGANQAVAAARLGGEVEFVGCFGDDAFGRRYIDHLKEEGVSTRCSTVTAARPTGCAMILVEQGGQNLIVVAPGANHAVTPDHVKQAADAIREADLVLVQLEIPLESVERVFRIANREGTPLLLNPSPVNPAFRLEGLAIDYLIVNAVEVEQLTGVAATADRNHLNEGLEVLLKRGARHVIVTRGAEPSIAVGPSGLLEVPAFSVDPVDTVGAGDTFAGALAVAVTEGMVLGDAVRFANCAAALSTLKLGAQSSMPNRTQVDARLRAG